MIWVYKIKKGYRYYGLWENRKEMAERMGRLKSI